MKTKLVTLSFFMFLSLTLPAQNSGLIFGVSGGATLSKMVFSGDYTYLFVQSNDKLWYLMPAEESSYAPRFNGGFDLGFRYGSFSILSGVHYSQLGGIGKIERADPSDPLRVDDNGNPVVGNYKGDYKINSLNFPILLRYEKRFENIGFALALGPVIHTLKGKPKIIRTGNEDGKNIKSKEIPLAIGNNSTEFLKKSFTSFLVRPSLFFNIGESGIFKVGVTYQQSGNMGNTNQVINYATGTSGNVQGTMKTSSIGLTVGYEYRLDFTLGAKY